MRISDRINQLAKYNITYTISSLKRTGDQFLGDIVAKFDNEGLEFIFPKDDEDDGFLHYLLEGDIKRIKAEEERSYNQILIDEIGEIKAKKIIKNLADWNKIMVLERHVILDFKMNKQYDFCMPSREYLKLK